MGALLWKRMAGAAAGVLLTAAVAIAGESVTTVDAKEATSLIASGVAVIDVRRAEEWRATGVVPGSHLITAFDAEGRLVPGFVDEVKAQVKPGEPVVLICRTGNRSGKAGRLLTEEAGFTHVYNVGGGVIGWQEAGRPLQPCANC